MINVIKSICMVWKKIQIILNQCIKCTIIMNGGIDMKHIKTINRADLSATAKKGGCGKCQASCQSACKTSCTVGNQKCERQKEEQV